MTYHIAPEATTGAFGELSIDTKCCRPLDTVTVRVGGRAQGDSRGIIRVLDANQSLYYETEIELTNNRGETRFTAAGDLGVQWVYLTWPDEPRYSRYLNFRVDCETAIETGDDDFDALYPFTRDMMQLGRREYMIPNSKLVGYTSADSGVQCIWLRDCIYGLPAYKYWEQDMSCGLDRFAEAQEPNGMIPDAVEPDGKTWRTPVESDVEYIMVLAVWGTWQVTGDDTWLAATMPYLARALNFIQTDPRFWDTEHGLVKRPHSCDTWDFDIEGAPSSGEGRRVIATCDQSGYYLAFRAMSGMYRHLGQHAEADKWATEAEEFRQRAVALLWDGTKFLHHFHVDPIDHGDFDESQQLAMGNTWAMTRGLASPEQAMRIIDEYRRRHIATGDAYPWWSLQPGYPDKLDYWPSHPHLHQGGYANGGLMPWVGGELCRAAFLFGREDYAVELLRQYADHLRRTGGAHVWYWPNGEPGFRTNSEVPYASWGMAEWLNALVEGLAGLQDLSGQMRHMQVAPRWAVTPLDKLRATVRYAVSSDYFSYRMRIDRPAATISLEYCGSGQSADFQVLLPAEWRPETVSVNGQPVSFGVMQMDASTYVTFPGPIDAVGTATVECEVDQV